MWMYDPNDDAYLTPEEQNAEYLQQNPALESALWSEWVGVVCEREQIVHPTAGEWDYLRSKFYRGKAPIDSVAELKSFRNSKSSGV